MAARSSIVHETLRASILQTGILEPVPAAARYLSFDRVAPAGESADALRAALVRLGALVDGRQLVVGLGQGLAARLGRVIDGLHEIPQDPAALEKPARTPALLWCWLRGDDRGDLVHLTRHIEQALTPALHMPTIVDAFRHREGRDLTGYVDGTENPQGDEALQAAFVPADAPVGLAGSSFVAVQQWVHNFNRFEALGPAAQDLAIGRRRADDVELDDAPSSAHVKRTAQESFEPEAFVLRRSMPWAQDGRAGLMFVAFGASLAAFEAQWRRMTGAEDGVLDALFGFTRPITGSTFWCPPMADGRPDWSAVMGATEAWQPGSTSQKPE